VEGDQDEPDERPQCSGSDDDRTARLDDPWTMTLTTSRDDSFRTHASPSRAVTADRCAGRYGAGEPFEKQRRPVTGYL